jgi:hypothetical protein
MGGDPQQESSAADRTAANREVLRQHLDDIAITVERRLREAGLNDSVYLVIPNSGEALAIVGTNGDPPDEEWSRIADNIQQILSDYLDGIALCGQNLTFATANTSMNAAEPSGV